MMMILAVAARSSISPIPVLSGLDVDARNAVTTLGQNANHHGPTNRMMVTHWRCLGEPAVACLGI